MQLLTVSPHLPRRVPTHRADQRRYQPTHPTRSDKKIKEASGAPLSYFSDRKVCVCSDTHARTPWQCFEWSAKAVAKCIYHPPRHNDEVPTAKFRALSKKLAAWA